MQHVKKEMRVRGYIPADWVWIVPPAGGAMTEVFHQEMVNFFIPPAYKIRRYTLKDLYERNPAYKYGELGLTNGEKKQEVSQKVKPFIFLYYASETGTAERFYEELSEQLGEFIVK
jgi:hypothetical protein